MTKILKIYFVHYFQAQFAITLAACKLLFKLSTDRKDGGLNVSCNNVYYP